jgi:hypothetical protein
VAKDRSVPLKSADDVLTTFGGALSPYLPAMPDGETRERKSWVMRLSCQIFNGHIDLETIERRQRANGGAQLMPGSWDDTWRFRVRAGADTVRFGAKASRPHASLAPTEVAAAILEADLYRWLF